MSPRSMSKPVAFLARRRRRDESGAILILSTVGLVLALIAAALSIDLGTLAQSARTDQKVADLAALDAVRVLPGTFDQTAAGSVTQAAKDSALRNGFSVGSPGYDLVVKWGPTKTGPFTSVPADLGMATAVQVTATSPHKNQFPFVSGPSSISRKAVSTKKNIAGFTMGTSLVNINTTSSELLNPIVGRMLGGTNANLSLVGWQGLAGGNVTLAALQYELAAMGLSVGTTDQLLNTPITLAQLYQASANAMTRGGDTANANVFNLLKAKVVSTATIKLGQMITVEQGAEDAAAGAQLNLLQLVTGSATVANGANLISVPSVNVTVPNVGNLALSLKLIDGPKTYVGTAGAGPHVTTSQVELTMTPTVNIVDLLGVLKVSGAFPVELKAGAAKGTLESIACPSKDIVVNVDPTAFSGGLKSSTLSVTTLLNVELLTVSQSNITPLTVDPPAQDLPFTYDSEFSPPNDYSRHMDSEPIGLKTLNNITGTRTVVNALGIAALGLNADGILASVLTALDNVVGELDSRVVTPLMNALGVTIGGADVTALGMDPVTGIGLPSCGLPALAS